MPRHSLVTLSVGVTVVACQAGDARPPFAEDADGRWIDLTYAFSTETVYWPTADPFVLERLSYEHTDAGYFYAANNFSAAEHGGTHLDAPVHFADGRDHVDEIPLERFIGPAVVIDVRDQVSPDYLVDVRDFERWEATNGEIPRAAIVLIRTGWSSRWEDHAAYLGTELTGPGAVPELHFPGLAPAAARWLTEQRSIDAIGIDTPSIDYGQSTSFESHVILYGANIPGFENVANLDQLPEQGSFVVALPMKIEGGSGAPLRIVAFVPE